MPTADERTATHTEARVRALLITDGYPATAVEEALEAVADLGLSTSAESDGRRRFTDAEYAEVRSRLDSLGLDPQEG